MRLPRGPGRWKLPRADFMSRRRQVRAPHKTCRASKEPGSISMPPHALPVPRQECTHTCVHVHVCTRTHIYICTHKRTRMCFVYACPRGRVCVWTGVPSHVHMHVCVRACVAAYVRTRLCACMHVHAHTHHSSVCPPPPGTGASHPHTAPQQPGRTFRWPCLPSLGTAPVSAHTPGLAALSWLSAALLSSGQRS